MHQLKKLKKKNLDRVQRHVELDQTHLFSGNYVSKKALKLLLKINWFSIWNFHSRKTLEGKLEEM